MSRKQEDNIALSLYRYVNLKRGHDIILPNFYLGEYEYDLIRFHANGFITEYEIKTSKSDFRKDFTKRNKGKYKHKELAKGLLPTNQFYFVVPTGMIEKDEVPTYVGLIHISPSGSTTIVKPAPFLHKRIYDGNYRDLALKLSYREMTWRGKYESLKLKNNENNVE